MISVQINIYSYFIWWNIICKVRVSLRENIIEKVELIYINLLNRISDFSSWGIGDNFNYKFEKSKIMNNPNLLVLLFLTQPTGDWNLEAETKKLHNIAQSAEDPAGWIQKIALGICNRNYWILWASINIVMI